MADAPYGLDKELGESSGLHGLLQDNLFREQVWQAAAIAGRHYGFVRLMQLSGELPKSVESPLEAAFWYWFNAAQIEVLNNMKSIDDQLYYRLLPQQWVEIDGRSYRLDFEVSRRAGRDGRPSPIKLAVELDGHTFHERTREQVATRNRRDGDLQALGFRVIHFSYSQVIEDGRRCALDTLAMAAKMDTQ